MKRFFLLAALFFGAVAVHAQLKVGLPAGAPDPSAILDASNTGAAAKKGFLAPKLALSSTADATTIINPANGLMVYNTTAAGAGTTAVTPGFYYNSGTTTAPAWVKLSTGSTDIYSANGTLSANRTVSLGNNNLVFQGEGRTSFVNSLNDYTDTNYAARFRSLPRSSTILLGGLTAQAAIGNKAVIAANPTNSEYPSVYFGASFLNSATQPTDADYFASTANGQFVLRATGNAGIGTLSPDSSALLDLTASSKGFLPPRVALINLTDAATVTRPATGLLVFNTATAGTGANAVTPGYYYYSGVKWRPLISEVPPSQATFDASVLGYTPTRTASTAPNDTTIGTNRFVKKWVAVNPDNGHSYALYAAP